MSRLPIRRSDLVVADVDGETVIYDPVTKGASTLTSTAAQVFAACDGRSSDAELREQHGAGACHAAIEGLQAAGLVSGPGVTRRRALAGAATGAGVFAAMIALPSAAAAASGTGTSPGGSPTPRTGNVLIYDDGTDPGLHGYTRLAAATGRTVETVSVLPTNFAPYVAVVLDLPYVPLTRGQQTALTAFVASGGRVLAIGEHYNAYKSTTLNTILANLGSSLRLDTRDFSGSYITTTVNPVVSGAHTIFYSVSNNVVGGGTGLVVGVNSQTLVRSEPVGAGRVVVLADTNILSDQSGTGYTKYDNGVLANYLIN